MIKVQLLVRGRPRVRVRSCAHRDEGGVASHEHEAIRINLGHLVAWVVLDVDIGREERGERPGKSEQHEDEQHEEIKDILDHAAHHADLQGTRMIMGCCPSDRSIECDRNSKLTGIAN